MLRIPSTLRILSCFLTLIVILGSDEPETAAQFNIPSFQGATNRFEKADAIYGVFGDINFPFGIEPDSYHRVYIMEGQYYESDYTYLTLGWWESPSLEFTYYPYYFWRTVTGGYGSDFLLNGFNPYQTHNYGVIYNWETNQLELWFDGDNRREFSASGKVQIADAAIAGSWVGPVPSNSRIGATFYNLQWVKRKANANGTLVRKTWPWSIPDVRVGPYGCFISSANSFTCDETF